MITIKRYRTRDMDEVHRHDHLNTVLEWWRGAGAPAPISALSPFVLPKAVLPRTALIDIEQSPRRYRFRLVGTGTYEDFGSDVTGRYVDELVDPEGLGIVLAGMDAPTDTATPHFASRCFMTRRGTQVCCFRLLLPLVDREDRVTRLLSVSELCSDTRNYADVYRQARRSVTLSDAAPPT